MKSRVVFMILFLFLFTRTASAQAVRIDATPVVSAYTEVVSTLTKMKSDEQTRLVQSLVQILSIRPPEGASDDERATLTTAINLAIQKILSSYPSGAALRVRQTKVVDIFQTSANTITIGLAPSAGIPATFGFTFGRETRQRAADEIEIEGSYAFNDNLAQQLIDVVRGDNALAILTKLLEVLARPQSQ